MRKEVAVQQNVAAHKQPKRKRVKQVVQTSQGPLLTIGYEGEELSPEAIALLNEPTPEFLPPKNKKARTDKHLDTTHTIEDIKNILRQGLMEKVGKLLAQARNEQHLTLKDVAEKTGVKHPRVVQLERGTNVEILTLARFAYALGYDLEIALRPRKKGKVLRVKTG
jgi:DNA-binding XRE family transcriptional regulator